MKRLATGGLALLVLLALGAGAGWTYLRSQRFQRTVEHYVLARIEGATGARAEAAAFHFQFRPLGFTLENLVLHGREDAGAAPLAVVPRVTVSLRLISVVSAQIKLERLVAQAPVVHVFRMPDGSSNLPRTPAAAPAQPLFDLGIRELRLVDGVLLWQDRRLPLDVQLEQVAVRLLAGPGQLPDAPPAAGLRAAPGAAAAGFSGQLAFAGGRVGSRELGAQTSLALRFTLWPDELRIDQASAMMLGSRIEFSGWVHQLTQPELDVNYRLSGALAPWLDWLAEGNQAGVHPVTTGAIEASGQLTLSATAWRSAGRFHAADVRVALPRWPAMTAQGDFSATPAGLQFAHVAVTAWGARMDLQGELAQWRGLRAQGELSPMRLAEVWQALRRDGADPRLLAALAPFDAEVAGGVSLTGRLDPAELALDLDLHLAPRAAAGLTPVSGAVRFSLQPMRDAVTIRSAQLGLAGTTIEAAGEWSPARLALQVSLDASDLGTVGVMLRPFAATARFAPTSGEAHIRGVIGGSPAALSFSGSVAAAHANIAGVAIDRLDAAGMVDGRQVSVSHASVSMGIESAQLSGTATLHDYRLAADSTLDLTLSARQFNLARILRIGGWDYPLVGVLTLQTRLTGTLARPAGSAQFAVAGARWQRQPIGAIAGHLQLDGDTASVNDLTVALGPSHMSGTVAVDFAKRSYAVALQAPAIRLADIAALQSTRLAVTGTARLSLAGAGAWSAPQASVHISTAGLSGNGETLGNVNATLQWRVETAQFTFSDTLPEGSLEANGDIGTSAPYETHARVVVRDYDFDAWLRRFTAAKVTGHSHIQGAVSIDGPLAEPRLLRAEANFDPVEAAVSGLVIRNQGAMTLTAAGGVLRLQNAHIVAPDTDFTADGTLRLDEGGAIDAQLRGTINAALLSSLQPTTHATGEVNVAARLSGTATEPELNGSVDIANGTLSEENLPIAFDHIAGRVVFTGNRAQIQSLTAQTGGGNVTLSGFATRTPAGNSYDVQATGSHLRLRYQGISATGDVKLRLDGTDRQGLVSGEVEMTGMGLNDNFDLALFIASTKTSPSLPNPNSLLNRVRLDVHLKTGPEVELATSAAHLQLQGDLTLRGTAANPSIIGRVSALEGNLIFGGIQYQVDKGLVQFVNPYRIEPQLDLGLSATVQQYNVSLQISGPVDKLNISYRSDPPLASADILALLATGQPTQADASLDQQSTSAFAGPSEQLLGRALDNVVAGRLHRLFGITQIQVNPNTGPTGVAGSGSSVTVQEQVSGAVRLTYTQNLSSSAQDILQVEWNINRFLGIVLNRDSYGLYGLSFELRHRAR